MAKVAQTFVAAKNFHLTLLRSFLLPSLLSLLLLLLRTLLTPCWPILKVQPKFRLRCLLARAHAHRMQINIQYTSCNDTHRAHSTHSHTLAHTQTLWHCNMSRCRIKFCLCLFTCSGRIRFLGFSIAFYHCILIFFFNELLNCLPHVASCLQVRGGRGECDRVVYFYYIVVRLPQLAEKVCNFILNSLRPFPLLSLWLSLQLKCNTHIHRHTLRTCWHTG